MAFEVFETLPRRSDLSLLRGVEVLPDAFLRIGAHGYIESGVFHQGAVIDQRRSHTYEGLAKLATRNRPEALSSDDRTTAASHRDSEKIIAILNFLCDLCDLCVKHLFADV